MYPRFRDHNRRYERCLELDMQNLQRPTESRREAIVLLFAYVSIAGSMIDSEPVGTPGIGLSNGRFLSSSSVDFNIYIGTRHICAFMEESGVKIACFFTATLVS